VSVYRVGFITVYVADLARSLGFYCDQLGLKTVYRDDKHKVALMDNEGATLILQQTAPHTGEAAWVGRHTGISLTVADLEAQINVLERRGVRFLQPPQQMFWGKRVASFQDPDKNILLLVG